MHFQKEKESRIIYTVCSLGNWFDGRKAGDPTDEERAQPDVLLQLFSTSAISPQTVQIGFKQSADTF